jgi:hypothetical protein
MSNSLSASAIVPDVSAPNLGETKAPATPAKIAPNDVVSLVPFLALMRELAAELIPMRLRVEFRDELQRELIAAARQQYARDLLIWSTPAPAQVKTSRRWVLGAATLGLGSAVSLASIVTAYYLRHRHRQAA